MPVFLLPLNTALKITAFYHIVTRWKTCYCIQGKSHIKIDLKQTKCPARFTRIDQNGKRNKQYCMNSQLQWHQTGVCIGINYH